MSSMFPWWKNGVTCASIVNCTRYECFTYNVSFETNSGIDRYQQKPGIEPTLKLTLCAHVQLIIVDVLRLHLDALTLAVLLISGCMS